MATEWRLSSAPIAARPREVLLELARYVGLYPKHAHMTDDFGGWPWGFCAATVGSTDPLAWLAADAFRPQVLVRAYNRDWFSLAEVARAFGVRCATLPRVVARVAA